MPYMTGHKKQILDFLIMHKDRHFTIEEIIDALSVDDRRPGKSTVYRQISNLLSDGVVRRFEDPGENRFVYQYAVGVGCDHHFHLKCSRCGRLIHMECDQLRSVREHILHEHNFLIGGNAIIYGICGACSADAKKKHE